MKRKRFPILSDGEWVKPKMSGYKMKCCDCGLIHKIDFVVIEETSGHILNGAEVVLRAYRTIKKKKIT